ncbi:MAG: hypothetical protein R3Y07_03375, partial [Eubacteriales bacterium]
MKWIKNILGFTLLGALFAGAFGFSYAHFQSGTTEFEVRDLCILEEEPSTFYLQKVPSDIKFLIEGSGELSLYDQENEELTPKIEKITSDSFYLAPPSGGYLAGETYLLELHQGLTFADPSLQGGDALQFTVEREVIEKVVYAPEVVEVHDPIYEREDNLIQIP